MKLESDPVADPDPGVHPGGTAGILSVSRRRWLIAAGAVLLIILALLLVSGRGSQAFKIYLTEPGVFRVTYEELQQAGLDSGKIRSRDLALSYHGEQVPIWVADGGDGRFGPGDEVEFVGEHLAGHRSYLNEYTLLNVYRLAVGESQGLRMSSPALPAATDRAAEPAHLEVDAHWEENNFLVHFPGDRADDPEPRFWERMTHIDSKPFTRGEFWLGRSRAGARPLSLAVQLRGWSTASRSRRGVLPDHRVELYFNGHLVGSGEWDGREAHVIEVPEVAADLIEREAANVIELKVPRRRPSPADDALVDVVLLDWMKVRFPPPEANWELGGSWVPATAQRFVLPRPPGDGAGAADSPRPKVRLATAPGARLVVFGAGGARFDSHNLEVEDRDIATLHHFYPPPEESVFHVVPTGAFLTPTAVELDRPSELKDPTRQADYIIIAHPRLLEAIEPLAAFHRRRGLEVAVVAVDDVYDEFNHGILHPEAVRDFLSYAYHQWQAPAPRFVLLVGDASWTAEGIGSRYVGGAPYLSQAPLSHRNLIPTSVFPGPGGHAASDNFFVAIDGDDHLPDMAIGRLPVIEPEEVTAIVDKTLRYADEVKVGPWRRNILWLADESSMMQERSDKIAGAVVGQGFASLKIYPSKDKPSTEQTQTPLLEAFDRGQLLVHFFGHGARFVWRTGVSDHRERFDLFGLEHLPKLKPNAKLPLVLSMTCWSAPFDHPTADSIGENFLRIEDRGAVAFFGASWKVSPHRKLSDLLIEGLTSPGTIGEAILRAKRGIVARNLIENYNLLGDPAIELALPRHTLSVVARDAADGAWGIVATMPEEMPAGRAVVDWLDDAGNVVRSDQLEVAGGRLETDSGQAGETVASVRVYVWDEQAGVDGMGALDLRPSEGIPEPKPSA